MFHSEFIWHPGSEGVSRGLTKACGVSMEMRIASFNIENLDDNPRDDVPFADRVPVLRPALERISADVLCLQEVHGQETPNEPRKLLALKTLIDGTRYENYHMATTLTSNDEPYDVRNLVVLSKYPISGSRQIRHDVVDKPAYRIVTATPEQQSKPIGWERPIQHVTIDIPDGRKLEIINLHLKSRRPSNVAGQLDGWRWKTAAGWAEGYFLSSLKRVGQALETRMVIDQLFDADEQALIAVVGDFNSEPGQVPVEAIAGRVENTQNEALISRVLQACSDSIPADLRFSHLYEGHGNLLDHILMSRELAKHYRGAEIHNELLHDESLSFAFDTKFPEADHAPFVARFEVD